MLGMRSLTCFAAFWFLHGPASADILNYRGRLTVDGAPVQGAAQFRFALTASDGTALWSTGDVDLMVRSGVYDVRLGEPSSKSGQLPNGILQQAPKLRIWWNRPPRGWQQLGEDVPLAGAVSKPPAAEITGAEAKAILAELKELRELVHQQAKSADAPRQFITVPMGDSPALGQPGAPLVLMEFIDFQSGPCRIYHEDTYPDLVHGYVETGKLRIVSRHLPQGALSEPTARAAVCAYRQGKYWEARTKLFALGSAATPESIANFTREAGLDSGLFNACFSGREAADAVQSDVRTAAAAGIHHTPTFILGRRDGDNVTGILLSGIIPQGTWEAEIYKLLTAPAAQKK
jgi:protein-disulfide isomerase